MATDGPGSLSGPGFRVQSLPPPRPKSPPDLYGRRREMVRLQVIEREKSFLEEELKFAHRLQPASRCCKEIVEFVAANADPLLPTNRKSSKPCRLWKWLCGSSCFSLSWICCCTGCSDCLKPPQCCSCDSNDCCSCIRCSLPKCSCCSNPCSCIWPENPCRGNCKTCGSPCFDCCSCKCNCSCPKCPTCSELCICDCNCNCSCPKCPSCSDLCNCNCKCRTCSDLCNCKCSCPKVPSCSDICNSCLGCVGCITNCCCCEHCCICC